jgi:transposase
MANFRPIDRATPFLLPPSVEDWLPKDHLARFVVDIVDQLDLSALTRQYRGSGSAAYHPAVMLKLAHLRLRHRRLCESAHRGGDA